MDYIIMLIACLVLSITLCVVFLFKNKVHTNESKIYSILMFSNLAGIILEIGSIYMSNKMLDSTIYDIVMHTYFAYILTFLTIMLFYIYSIYTNEENKNKYRIAQIASFIALTVFPVAYISSTI